MTHRLNLVLLALLLLAGLPAYWLLIDNRPGQIRAKPLHIAELRRLAASMPGSAPSRVEVEVVAFRRVPGNFFVAGSGLKRQLIAVMAYRLPVADGRAILIDSGMTPDKSAELGMELYDSPAQARVNRAMREAGTILLTHEHFDHEGGLVALADPAVFARTRFNAAQLPGNPVTALMRWPNNFAARASLAGTAPIAIAPGVVVIPAPSHTPGSQMIYVRLASGREVLFTGDVATMTQSWRELRARSRLIGQHLVREDRGEVYAWLRTIRALKAEAPALEVLSGHDGEYITHDKNFRGLTEHFRF